MITLNSESAICLTKVLFGVILIIYCLSRRYLVLLLQVIWSLAFSIKLCGDTEKASDFFRWGYLRIFFKNGESGSSFTKVCFTKFKTIFSSIKSWIDSNGKCAWHPLNFCKTKSYIYVCYVRLLRSRVVFISFDNVEIHFDEMEANCYNKYQC